MALGFPPARGVALERQAPEAVEIAGVAALELGLVRGKIGKQMVSYAGGVRGYAESPDGGPDWGVRFVLTLLYPK